MDRAGFHSHPPLSLVELSDAMIERRNKSAGRILSRRRECHTVANKKDKHLIWR
ncbi:hypothetical protein PEC301899_24420 [Pectobacterium carotovorum subsp. carotovorum]|nr:hypothetical protein PEC301899_24420 [Pectobacterium carotovorum subsp. carotovorum]